jgi:hypothetical protein
MYPHERSLVAKYNEHFAIVGINSDRGRDRLKEAMAREQITWTSFYDGGGTGPGARAVQPAAAIAHQLPAGIWRRRRGR